jgi:signal transduction histidine kinase
MLRRIHGLSEQSWQTLDRVVVAGLVAIAVVDLSTNSKVQGPLWLNFLVLISIELSFLWRRSRPVVTVAWALAGFTAMAVWLTEPPDLFVAVLTLVCLGYAAGRHMRGRESLASLAVGAVVILTLAVIYDPSDVFFPVTFFWGVPWLVGRTLRNQTRLTRELAEKSERAQHAREEDERRAIALERNRIARELHDVLAHNLSVMVVQASGARQVLEKSPERAAEAAELIERTGREALDEIRQLFGPVRRGGPEPLSGAQSITRVGELARRARDAGLGVELRVLGEAVELPGGIDLAAYRIVQEALTNTLKHSPGARARVTVSYEPNELVLSVQDDGAGTREGYALGEAGGGHGLAGMRERAAVYGGVVQAGAAPDGGFAVHARLPTRAAVPA